MFLTTLYYTLTTYPCHVMMSKDQDTLFDGLPGKMSRTSCKQTESTINVLLAADVSGDYHNMIVVCEWNDTETLLKQVIFNNI